jgi:hypothetical protein
VEALQNSSVQSLAPFVTVIPGELNGLTGPHVIFEGANVHVRSGSGSTSDNPSAADPPPPLTGLGNLVVGYNENTPGKDRTGAHNLIVGPDHGYSSFGGFVAGNQNNISAPNASVSGGVQNEASGSDSSVSGGVQNWAVGADSSILGGVQNYAAGEYQTIPAIP